MQIASVIVLFALLVSAVQSETLHYTFVIKEATYTRLCHTKKILTVNGEFPGPTIKVRKGDTAIVRVYNQGHDNITIHWHGVNQPRNPWHDGPAYITQCPIKSGSVFTYKIIFSDEEGTLWWHAHSAWNRATVHGAITIRPQIGSRFPFSEPHGEFPIILGEWWKKNTKDLLQNIIQIGGLGIVADSYTINGQPGDLYPCSKNDTHTINVKPGKTYLLRIINAAMHSSLFFAVGGHHVIVVAIDASYTKPFITTNIIIYPGQTIDVLLETKPEPFIDTYYIAASAYSSVVQDSFPSISATALLQYSKTYKTNSSPLSPSLPYLNDTNTIEKFTSGLRSLASEDHPIDVPTEVDERIVISVAVNLHSCSNNETCVGPRHSRLTASLNNISFVAPSRVDVLEAYYKNISGVFEVNFPNRPPASFDFTGDNLPPMLLEPRVGTEVKVLEYGTNVEIVLQGTNLLGSEYHPLHLHGYSFYVVGKGFGNFDEVKDPMKYNIVDPQKRNTVGVPKSGWTAIRFKATNPGVWFMHCHFERHLTWGMSTVFIVRNGIDQESSMLPQPRDMPPC